MQFQNATSVSTLKFKSSLWSPTMWVTMYNLVTIISHDYHKFYVNVLEDRSLFINLLIKSLLIIMNRQTYWFRAVSMHERPNKRAKCCSSQYSRGIGLSLWMREKRLVYTQSTINYAHRSSQTTWKALLNVLNSCNITTSKSKCIGCRRIRDTVLRAEMFQSRLLESVAGHLRIDSLQPESQNVLNVVQPLTQAT